ncbi:MAG: ModE family transcriptional regulator [Promethearchaeota archaeon CR_4]|nr:MAG: ModE family transcriptional regulator [Candidatus Lokiarchaeota archaeon CR_4]
MAGDAFPTHKLKVKKKAWLEFEGKNLLGEGGASLLQAIADTQSLTIAAEQLGYSYKYAWMRLKKLHERTGLPVVDSHKGGLGGGGRVTLTPWGRIILEKFQHAEESNAKDIG